MMKKVLFGLSAILALFATSCQNELDTVAAGGDTSVVTFSIETPELATRAYSNGETATVLHYALFDLETRNFETETGVYLSDLEPNSWPTLEDKKGSVSFKLVTGNMYRVVFWAAAPNAPYEFDAENATVTVKYTNSEEIKNALCNDEKRDAFFACADFAVDGNKTVNVQLKRPFAQLNIGTNDYEDAKKANVIPAQSQVIVKNLANKLDLFTGAVDGDVAVTFASADIKTDETFPVTGYEYLAMNYLLVNEKKVVDIEFTCFDDKGRDYTRTVGSVPVQRNYRTNIYGQILTSTADLNVEIVPEYYGKNNILAWDGKTLNAPEYVEETSSYMVDDASELAYIAALLNGTITTRAANDNNFNIVLTKDINLGDQIWTPIGTSANPFKGTFDGANHIVHNLYIPKTTESNKGLFGVTQNGEIKNLVVNNAKVAGRLNVGVVAGTPYTSKYTNITVKGLVQVEGMAYVGAVGGKNAYADWTNITVDAEEGSYVKANSIENGTAYRTYVGGVVGFNGEGGHTFKNITSNINVEGTTCDVGGLFGIAHYGNNFENCVCKGNVEITNAEEAEEAQEIGGIAGVWHNADNSVVTMNNCSFTGTLSTNVATTYCYGGLVGKSYNATGTGKLYINGNEFDKDGIVLAAINEVLAAGGYYTLPFDITVKATASNAYGHTALNQINGGTIDGNGFTFKATGAGGTWGSAINTTGGTIKNITVAQGFRGIFINHNSDYSEKVILENVTINGPTYTISCDQGKEQGLEAYNCTINGWTSYAKTIGKVKFENCSFGKGAGYKFCRPYAPTTFINCNFCEGYEIDAREAVVLVNCTLNGVPVTEENLATLVTGNIQNAGFAPVVENVEDLKSALTDGAVYVKVAAGEYTFPSSSVKAGVTIECAEGTKFTGNSKLNINGAKVIGATFSNPGGTAVDQTINGKFVGCTFEGSNALRWCYAGETCVFENCVFSGSTYGVHFDGGANYVTFRNCTLSGFNAFAGATKMVTFDGCTFVGNGKSGYNGANLWGSATMKNCEFTFNGTTANEWIDCIGADKTYVFENCTVNGEAYTSENYTEYLNNIESRNEITVTINGVECEM